MRCGLLVAMSAMCACGGSGGFASIVADAGGTSDPGVTDAGLADAGTADDCTGIVPAVPASASAFDIGASGGQSCSVALTDSSGVMAAESHTGTASGAAAQVDWHEFDARGISAGSFTGGVSLSPQAVGFLGLQGNAGALSFDWWNGSGTLKNLAPVGDGTFAITIATGFPSGAIVVRNTSNNVLVQSFDANANLVNSVPIATTSAVLAAAQDRSDLPAGQGFAQAGVLVVLANGQGVWVDLVAGSSGTPFAIGTGATAIARALIGGGVAVRFDGRWTTAVSTSNTLSPPPPWLTDGSDFVISRGGKAYAVTTPGSNVIPLAVGRTTCGSITLQGATSVSVGIEGTVIGSSGSGGCGKIFWSKLLQ